MTWTDQKIQMLRDMWGNGYSASDIAKRLGGLTRNAVIGKAHRLKLSGRPSPIQRDDAGTPKATGMVRAKPAKKVMLRALPTLPQPPMQMSAVPAVKRTTESLKSAVSPLKTTERQCRWPHGDPRSRDFKFCGCQAVEGLPYCMDHARAAYQNFGRGGKKREEETTVSYAPQPMAAAAQ
jgi:GcrA cell cycle regulator